jgi:hypothetical protein
VASVSWRIGAAVVVAVTTAGPARAFYWQNWPGSQLHAAQTLVDNSVVSGKPSTTQRASVPPSNPNGPTPDGPPDAPPVTPPTQTPEPATALLGVVGLGAVAVVRKWKRKG